MPVLEAIFIGTAAFSALMGIEHSKKTQKKAPKKKTPTKKKAPAKKKTPVKKKAISKKKTPAKKKTLAKKKALAKKKTLKKTKKPSGKRWETKLALKKELSKRGFKFTNAQLKNESITDLRRLLKTLKN